MAAAVAFVMMSLSDFMLLYTIVLFALRSWFMVALIPARAVATEFATANAISDSRRSVMSFLKFQSG
jgi:hypothetical protein